MENHIALKIYEFEFKTSWPYEQPVAVHVAADTDPIILDTGNTNDGMYRTYLRYPDQHVSWALVEGLDPFSEAAEPLAGRPRLRVRVIERTALVHFLDSEVLFEEAVVRAISDQLERLIEEGHTRVLLNFGGVRYLSCVLIGRLAALQQEKIAPVRGRLQLCGLEPLLKDVLRITQLEREFDVCDDEAQALGLILP
jgi:anti-anti-sigma factor